MSASRVNKRKVEFLDEIVVKTISIENFDRRKNEWENKVKVWADDKRATLKEKFRNKSLTDSEFKDYMKKLDEKIDDKQQALSAERNVQKESLQFWFQNVKFT